MYGRGYVAEHIAASYHNAQEELRYKNYVTEAMRILTENSTHFLIPGVGDVNYGSYIEKPWYNPGTDRAQKQEQKKTAEEIAADVILRAGLKIESGEDNA